MAAGSAGSDVAAPMPGDYDDAPESIDTLRATMLRMSDSIASLSKQMAELMECPEVFMNRRRNTTDPGPAVRARSQDQEIQRDRTRMMKMEEALSQNHQKVEDLESTLAL